MRIKGRWLLISSATMAMLAWTAQTAMAQRAAENAVTQSDDAFGTSVGNEQVEIEGVHVGPGDRVVVVDAPGLVAFGEQRDFVRVARITRATRLQRLMARIEGYLELTELYEVGFSEGRG